VRKQLILRASIFIATLAFLAITIEKNLQELSAIWEQNQAWCYGGLALGVSLLAHLWSAWVWSWILRDLQQPVSRAWAIAVFLKNSPAKYIPGNIWHLYGRVRAAQKVGIAVEVAALSVLLEPLLIAAAALTLVVLSTPLSSLQGVGLALILLGVHPRLLNPILRWIERQRSKPKTFAFLRQYPLRLYLGEVVFMGLRVIGFLLAVLVFVPLNWAMVRPLVGGFSFAWLLGLVTPGAPGGLGIFEATAIALLNGYLTPGLLLGIVALYRFVSTLAEIVGAGLAWLIEQRSRV